MKGGGPGKRLQCRFLFCHKARGSTKECNEQLIFLLFSYMTVWLSCTGCLSCVTHTEGSAAWRDTELVISFESNDLSDWFHCDRAIDIWCSEKWNDETHFTSPRSPDCNNDILIASHRLPAFCDLGHDNPFFPLYFTLTLSLVKIVVEENNKDGNYQCDIRVDRQM